jgi:hypothetical protein
MPGRERQDESVAVEGFQRGLAARAVILASGTGHVLVPHRRKGIEYLPEWRSKQSHNYLFYNYLNDAV